MSKLPAKLAILLTAATATALAGTINFEAQCPAGQQASGPCSDLFSTVGNAQTLTIPTSIGDVTIQGGALFDDIANLPVDETAVYGTAGNATGIGVSTGTGFTNPITITFPAGLTSFSLDVLNGNTTTVEYQLADNLGNIQDLTVAPNFSSGLQVMRFATTGTVFTLTAVTGQSTPSGMTFDFLIDNIDFTTRSTTPEPASALFIGIGLLALGLIRRRAKCVLCLVAALPLIHSASAATTAIALTCPSANGELSTAYSSSFTPTGGVPPYTVSISSGNLPGGLTLNASTGAISGTPTQSGTFAFTGKVVDSLVVGAGGSPDSTTASCSISIAGALTITNLSPYTAVAGGPGFTLTVDGTGFTPSSVVSWNGASLATTYINATQLTALVPASLFPTPEFAAVTVSNGGLVSNAATFSVLETWVQILDQYAVTFGQLIPADSNLVADWQIGMAFADYNELSRDGFTGGYIQVLEFDSTNPDDEGAWVVQNLPIESPQALAGNGRPFTFAATVAGPLAGTNAAVYHTMFAAAPPKKAAPGGAQPPAGGWQPVKPAPARTQFFPIRQVPSSIGGMLVPPVTNPPAPVDVQPIDPAMKRTDSQDSLTDADSVTQQKMECAPSSVSNSMEYLGIKDGAKNVPSAQANSRVKKLDTLMGFTALGTSAYGILTGKEAYINGQNPTGAALKIAMDSQGMFCPTPSLDPKCVGLFNGKMVAGQPGASGTTVTADFITDALAAKKDVEVCFAWAAYPPSFGPPPTAAQPGGAHCVFVTGYRFVNGFLTLDCTQDLNQGGKVPGTGWENGGHVSIRVGTFNDQLWIRSFFGRPALITNVITEAPK